MAPVGIRQGSIDAQLFAAAMLTLGISSASADQLDPTVQQLLDPTVQGLYRMCKGQDTSDNLMCIAYVAGVGDLLRAQGGKGEKYSICADPTYGAEMQAFVKWAEANPQEWGKDRIFGVVSALIRNWPCSPSH